MAKKRRSAAQRAATKKMLAANRSRARRSTPKRRARRANPVTPLVRSANPSRRRRARRSSVARVVRRRRSNPIGGGIVRELMDTLMPSAIGGLGALGVDVAMAVVPLPESIKTGALRPVARIAGAVAVGALAGMVTNKRVGRQVMAGAVTVVLYDTLKGMAAKVLGGKVPGLGLYDIPGIGMYEVGPTDALPAPDMGYYDAGIQVGDGVSEYVNG